jgi:ABC-type lipoprotein export system ATPase subunit
VVAHAGCALVLVTHDENAARRADRTVHLRDGRLEEAPPSRPARRVLRAAAPAS